MNLKSRFTRFSLHTTSALVIPPSVFTWLTGWHVLFSLALIAMSVLALFQPEYIQDRGRILLLTVVLLGWYGGAVYRGNRLQTAPLRLLAYLVVGWLAWFALTYITQLYMLLLFVLFPHLFITLKLKWASVGALILMALVVLRQMTETGQEVDVWLMFMSVATFSGILLAYFINAILNEIDIRQQLILNLEKTQRELAEAEREAGILQERQRLAGEIHDTLAQGLISIVTHLEATENAISHDPASVRHHLTEAKSTARASLNEARRFVWALQPKILEDQAFPVALSALVGNWSTANSIAADVCITGVALTLRPEQEVALLRVTQEALANSAKHAHARHVTVTLSYMPDVVILDVHDDGIGFDPAATAPTQEHGYGLVGMRERIERLNGRFEIESVYGEGTTIFAELPVMEA